MGQKFFIRGQIYSGVKITFIEVQIFFYLGIKNYFNWDENFFLYFGVEISLLRWQIFFFTYTKVFCTKGFTKNFEKPPKSRIVFGFMQYEIGMGGIQSNVLPSTKENQTNNKLCESCGSILIKIDGYFCKNKCIKKKI